MIKRLRPAHSPERLKKIYAQPHNSEYFMDHDTRVEVTISVGKFMLRYFDPWTPKIADLSCGNAKIPRALSEVHIDGDNLDRLFLGDIAEGYRFQGPIEETIEQIPRVALFVCSETLEHINDPLGLLMQIRSKADMLLLSTPIDEPEDSKNEQHYWSWGTQDIENLLRTAGWTVSTKSFLYLPTYYDFQIWGCS